MSVTFLRLKNRNENCMHLENINILSVLPLLGHPRDSKRIAMLQQAGFNVEAVAFERDYHTGRMPDCPVESLGKIPNTQRIVAQWINPGLESYTAPPGIIGDLYINFGIVGILGMVVFGIVLGRIEKMRGLVSFIYSGAVFMPIFHLVRGGFTNLVMIGLSIYIGCKIIASSIKSRAEIEMEGQHLWSNS